MSLDRDGSPGPRNAITDVPGLRVGQAEDRAAWTGVTVVLPDAPAVVACDIRGGGPGTRETDLLAPSAMVERVHALCLSGGSAFGLEAASGVVEHLAAQGIGFAVGAARVPIVPAAILFDLLNGGDKAWATPPYRALARTACEQASLDVAQGNAGAGYGAKAGRLKGGLGTASLRVGEDWVGALVAANPVGSVLHPGTVSFWAWPFEQLAELGGQVPPSRVIPNLTAWTDTALPQLGANTTLAVVATDAPLTKADAQRLAIMAQDGLARAIRPVHTPFDGDSVFALATGDGSGVDPYRLARLGQAAADCVARAVARGVYEAETLGAFPGYRTLRQENA
jgi:L-aminopeptidase/D-esterase-like protein